MPQLLDALDHFLHQALRDAQRQHEFYAATTPAEMVSIAEDRGIMIGEEDFRALLRSGTGAYWIAGGAVSNPITHLRSVFNV